MNVGMDAVITSNILDYIKYHTAKGIKTYKNNPMASLKFFIKAYRAIDETITNDVQEVVVYNLALTYYTLNMYDNAIKLYRLLPESHHDGMYELALSYFSKGDLVSGRDFYRHRYLRNTHDTTKFPQLPIPFVTDQKSIADKTVLVLNEQGFGDELMFSRVLGELSRTCKSAFVQVYPELFDVINTIKPDNITLFTARSFDLAFVQQFDVYTCLGDMWLEWPNVSPPKLMSSKPSVTIPRDGFNIGFVQTPNVISKNAKQREVNVKLFKSLSLIPGIKLHSLQRGSNFSFATNYNLDTFDTTLDIINQLDLVVTIDTSVAHLAAMSTTPTAIVYTGYLDWRWKNNLYQVDIIQSNNLLKYVRCQLDASG